MEKIQTTGSVLFVFFAVKSILTNNLYNSIVNILLSNYNAIKTCKNEVYQ